MQAIGSGWEKPDGDVKQLSSMSGFDRWLGEWNQTLPTKLLAEEITDFNLYLITYLCPKPVQ